MQNAGNVGPKSYYYSSKLEEYKYVKGIQVFLSLWDRTLEQPKSQIYDSWAWLFPAEKIREVEKKRKTQGYIVNKTWINN